MVLVLDNNLGFLGWIMDALCCSQCPAALDSLLCSMATTQTKNNNQMAADITVVSVRICSKYHSIMDAIGVSIATSRVCEDK